METAGVWLGWVFVCFFGWVGVFFVFFFLFLVFWFGFLAVVFFFVETFFVRLLFLVLPKGVAPALAASSPFFRRQLMFLKPSFFSPVFFYRTFFPPEHASGTGCSELARG